MHDQVDQLMFPMHELRSPIKSIISYYSLSYLIISYCIILIYYILLIFFLSKSIKIAIRKTAPPHFRTNIAPKAFPKKLNASCRILCAVASSKALGWRDGFAGRFDPWKARSKLGELDMGIEEKTTLNRILQKE